jgi:hypothetical protein
MVDALPIYDFKGNLGNIKEKNMVIFEQNIIELTKSGVDEVSNYIENENIDFLILKS